MKGARKARHKHKHRSRASVQSEGKVAKRSSKGKRGEHSKRSNAETQKSAPEKPRTSGNKREGDTTSQSSSAQSTGSSVKSLKVAMKDIVRRQGVSTEHTEKVKEASIELSSAADTHSATTSEKAQRLREDLGAIIPKIHKLLADTEDGQAQVQALNLAWGYVNNNTIQGDEALHRIHNVVKEALDTITQSMQTRDGTDHARDMLHRRQEGELEKLDALLASLRKTQWGQQLQEHAKTWSFKGFPKQYTDGDKKGFMYRMAHACGQWAAEHKKGGIHMGALTTTGTEGEFAHKFRAINTDSPPETLLPKLHFMSPEEAELFGEFASFTASGPHWVAPQIPERMGREIRVKAIKTTQEGSVAEAACYALRIILHILEKEGTIEQQGEYKYDPAGQYLGQTPGFEQNKEESKLKRTGRVFKSDLLVALRNIHPPHDENMLAGAFVDTKDDNPYEHPRIIIRISEEHAAQVAQAAINHLKRGIGELHSGAYKSDARKTPHPATGRPIKLDIVDLTKIKQAAEKELENISITQEDRPGQTGDYKIGDAIEQAIGIAIADYWGCIADGGLQFQDMNYNSGKATTAIKTIDWFLTYRQQRKGEEWEHRGRSRSRATQRSQPPTDNERGTTEDQRRTQRRQRRRRQQGRQRIQKHKGRKIRLRGQRTYYKTTNKPSS